MCYVTPTGNQLGHGAYGDVLEVEYKGKVYAAKKYRIDDKASQMLGAFSREHEILALMEISRHPNIVRYHGICRLSTDHSTVIVMERMDVNLDTYLVKNPNISLAEKLPILLDIAKGLDHLHWQKPAIIHRDLTAGNVLLNLNGKDKVAKIGDFGNSRLVDLKSTPEIMTSNPGTLDYMPPEAVDGGDYDEKLDIFSYGHLGIHIVIQRRPHPLLRHNHKKAGKLLARTEVERRQVYLQNMKAMLDGGDAHPLYTLIIQCLNDEPAPRPSCEEILKSRIFSI